MSMRPYVVMRVLRYMLPYPIPTVHIHSSTNYACKSRFTSSYRTSCCHWCAHSALPDPCTVSRGDNEAHSGAAPLADWP